MRSLQRLLFVLAAAVAALAPSACGPAQWQVSADVTPRMVMVSPGIWLVADHPFAVYYTDGFYWRFVDGIWYRSPYYDAGFVHVDVAVVPRVVVGAYRPIHVRYRPPAHVQSRPIIRDHRAPRRRR